MVRLKKTTALQNLLSYTVLIEDLASYSEYFRITDFNPQFTAGRNGFLIAGTFRLKPGSDIKIEIIDSNGAPVFNAPIRNYVEGGSRLIQAEVYSDTPAGPGRLIIMGQAETFPNGQPVPSEWANKYNVRWTVPIHIEPKRNNTNKIRFYSYPQITANETPNQQNKYIDRTFITESNFNISIRDLTKNQLHYGYTIESNYNSSGSSVDNVFYFTSPKQEGYFTGSINHYHRYVIEDLAGTEITENYKSKIVSSSIYLPVGRIYSNYRIFSTASIQFPPEEVNEQNNHSNRVVSNRWILPNLDLTGGGTSSVVDSFFQFESASATYVSKSLSVYETNVSFVYPNDQSVITQGSSSVFTYRLNNLSTSTGEVSRVRISAKPFLEKFSAYETLYEFNPVKKNILFESSSAIGDTTALEQFDIGSFVTSSYYDQYWVAGYMTSSQQFDTEFYNTGSTQLTLVTSSLVSGELTRGRGEILNGIYINVPSSSVSPGVWLGTKKPYQFFTNTEYTLKYDAVCKRKFNFPNTDQFPNEISSTDPSRRVRFYISPHTSSLLTSDIRDSAVPMSPDSYGLEVDSLSPSVNADDSAFYDRRVNFSVPSDGLGHVRIVIDGGYWEFGNISISPAEERGFSLDEIIFTVDNTKISDSTVVFRAEFFDINNNSIDLKLDSVPYYISGSVTVSDEFQSLSFTRTSLTGDGSTTVFTLSGSATTDNTFVLINGVETTPTEDYTISGVTLTFIEAPPSGSEVVARSVSIV
ncbi:MAG: hypothetical protein VW683_00420 [Betaproteobacteria bacterium]|jgi:hypothetical protein